MKGWIETRQAMDGKRYDACWRVGATKKSKTFTRRKDADTFLTDTVRKVQTGEYREIKPTTLGAYAERWLEGLAHLKPSARGGYTIALRRHLLPALGGLPMAQIGAEEVNAYLASKADTLRPKSLVNHLAILSKILSDAVAADRLTANRLLKNRAIRRPKAISEADEITVEVPTLGEVNVILDALPPAWQPFFMTLALTGLRFGEAIGLRWMDLDEENAQLAIRRSYYRGHFLLPKTKRSRRSVDLGNQLLAVLQNLRRERFGPALPTPGALIFVRAGRRGSPTQERPLNASVAREIWLAALKQTGVRHLRMHALRHFFASAQIALGTNIKYISTQLGHASAQITVDRYGHLFPDERRVAARRLETMLGFPAALPSGTHPAKQDVNAVPRS
jgi:integrase